MSSLAQAVARIIISGATAALFVGMAIRPGPAQEQNDGVTVKLLVESPGVVGAINRMTPLEREVLLARAMGRALAHEMGHYLLSSKAPN